MVVSYHLLPKLLKADKLDFNIGKPILTQINRIDECREGKGNSATRGSLRQRKDEKKKTWGEFETVGKRITTHIFKMKKKRKRRK